jgi:hypothetical protein
MPELDGGVEAINSRWSFSPLCMQGKRNLLPLQRK